MQLRHLLYLQILAKEKHFGRAAKILSVSQSALTQAIQQLEKHFRTPILHRHQGGFQGFTSEGESILGWARNVLHEHDRLLGATSDEMSDGLRGKLRIGLSPVCMAITSLLTTPFAESYPGVTVSALCSTMPEIERALRSFELDVGVTYLDGITQTNLRPYVLYEEAYYLLVPDDHYLSKQEVVSWREVGGLPLCLLSPNLHNRIIIDRIFAEVGVSPQAVIETNCSLGLFAHMRTGRWLTIVPHSYSYLLGDWLFIRAIPIADPSVTNTIGLVIHEREPIAPAIRAFIEVAQRAEIGKQLDRYRRRPAT